MARHADQIEIECRWCGKKRVVLRSYYNAQKRAGNTPAYCNRTHFVLDSMGSREKFLRPENLTGVRQPVTKEEMAKLKCRDLSMMSEAERTEIHQRYGKPIQRVYEFRIEPVAKPRMTQRDRWAGRPVVERYFAFKDEILVAAKRLNFTMPDSGYHLKFFVPMPESWSEKKKTQMDGRPHQKPKGPDKDNLEKAFLDAICEDDGHVYDGRVSKFWSRQGRIVFIAHALEVPQP